VSLLDGGRLRWLESGPTETGDAVGHAAEAVALAEPSPELRAFRNDILPRLHRPDLAPVDVRSPDEFSGTVIAPPGMPETAQRGGHIPGAVLVPWDEVIRSDGTFKGLSELRDLYERAGVTADRDVVTYCRIGERSSHSWFVLHELLGYPHVRNYDGSWTEWGSSVGVPIERTSVA
jgi:thiosulfate/3-mercaptopyruvate sulfurtransferase